MNAGAPELSDTRGVRQLFGRDLDPDEWPGSVVRAEVTPELSVKVAAIARLDKSGVIDSVPMFVAERARCDES